MLKIKNLQTGYNEIQTIFNVNIEVKKNEIVVIMGQNGSGKSSLLLSILGLLPLKSGIILFKNENLIGKKISYIIKKGIILVPEGAGIFPNMNVIDNLLIGAYYINSNNIKNEKLTEVFNLFPRLKERAQQLAGTLSGGERQMLAIGRALMSNPELILFDEPSLGLQPKFVDKIFNIILHLKKKGKTILLVEQNLKKSLEIGDRAYILEHGKIVMEGKCKELKNNEYVKKAYLGI